MGCYTGSRSNLALGTKEERLLADIWKVVKSVLFWMILRKKTGRLATGLDTDYEKKIMNDFRVWGLSN